MWPQRQRANGGAAAHQVESEKEEDETAADLIPSEKDALLEQARSTVLGKAILQSHLSYLSSGEGEEESESDEQLAWRPQAEGDEQLEEVLCSHCQSLMQQIFHHHV
jgi:hypothetical protein